MKSKSQKYCVLCGDKQPEVIPFIETIDKNFICVECLQQVNEEIQNQFKGFTKQIVDAKNATIKNSDKTFNENVNHQIKVLQPIEIKKYLDDYVIGQEEAKKVLSVAVSNHLKRLKYFFNSDIEVEKSNILLIGQTGTGKTLLAKHLAKLLKVPFTIADATVFTEAGYVGEDIESILSRLLQACNYNVAEAEMGVVYIDEIDKIARKTGANPSISKDVGGEGVQQGLLKLLEGSDVLVPPQGGRKHPDQQLVKINTKNILFICGGAFESIDKIIKKRINTNSIGFNTTHKNITENKNMLQYVSMQDLKTFGMIPELLGRLPVLTYLNALDKKSLIDILTKPKNAIVKQYQELFAVDKCTLIFTPEALAKIVDYTMAFDLGARGLRSICEKVLLPYMFEMDMYQNKTITITPDIIDKQLEQHKLQFSSPAA